MADTIREQIIAAYVARLQFWTTRNGFNFSCGRNANRAIQNIEYEELPACVLWPQIETVEQRYSQNVCEMVLKIEALSAVGEANPSIIQENLLGDAIKIMTDPSVIVTALIEDIVYTGGGPASISKAEDKTTAIYAEFKIKYETLIGNPYSQ